MCKVEMLNKFQEKSGREGLFIERHDRDLFEENAHRKITEAKLDKVITGEKLVKVSFEEKLNKINKELKAAWALFYDIYEIDRIEKQWQKQRNDNLFNKAKNYMERSFYTNAIDVLRLLTDINPKEAKYHSYLGLAILKKGMPKVARLEFDIALTLDANDPLAVKYYNAAGRNVLQKRKDEEVRTVKTILHQYLSKAVKINDVNTINLLRKATGMNVTSLLNKIHQYFI